MRRVLEYLKHAQNFSLHYKNYSAVIEGYSDANWIAGSTESKSTSGYVFTVGGKQCLGNLLSKLASPVLQWKLNS